MAPGQRYRLRTRSGREIVREVEPGAVYVDHETGEDLEIVGKVLPLAPSVSHLPWTVENLRLCGCSLEQLAPRDANDCPHCGRRLPAAESRENDHPPRERQEPPYSSSESESPESESSSSESESESSESNSPDSNATV